MIVSIENLARGKISTPALVIGYSAAALSDGLMSVPWRGAQALVSHTFTLGQASPIQGQVDLVGIFDARLPSSATASITEVRVDYVLGGTTTTVGYIQLNDRGDGVVLLSPRFGGYYRLIVTCSVAAQLQVGEIWVGRQTRVRAVARLTNSEEYGVIVNGDFARLVDGSRRSYSLTWPPVGTDDSREIIALLRSARGGVAPVVAVPDEIDGTPILGRLGRSTEYSLEPHRWRQGHGLSLTEGRRVP